MADAGKTKTELLRELEEARGRIARLEAAQGGVGGSGVPDAGGVDGILALMEAVSLGMYECDTQGVITTANRTLSRITGYGMEELIGKPVWELMAPGPQRDSLPGYFQELLRELPDPLPFVCRDRTKDGRLIDVQIDWTYRRDEEGKVAGYACVLSDITERLRMERALRGSEDRYRTTLESFGDPIHVVDRTLNILLINAAFRSLCERNGLSSHVLGKTVFDVFPFLEDRVRGEYDVVFSSAVPLLTMETAAIDGQETIMEVRKLPVCQGGVVTRVVTVLRDVTDRVRTEEALRAAQTALEERVAERTAALTEANTLLRAEVLERAQAEQALRDSEANFRRTFEEAADAIFWADVDSGVLINCNRAAESLTERGRSEIIGTHHLGLHPPERREHYEAMFVDHVRQTGRFHGDAQILTGSGAIKHVDIVASRIVVGGETILQGTFRDITELRESEAERTRLATAIQQSGESVMITDLEGVIEYVNPAFEQQTGYGRAEVLGNTPSLLNSGCHDGAFYEDLWGCIRGGEVWQGHLVNRRKDGTLFEEEATISPISNEFGEISHFVAIKHDVTTRMNLERQLRRAQQMESIGTLASGIAHDFKNILSLIMGYSDFALHALDEEHPAYLGVRHVIKASNRASALISRLLTLGGRAERERRPVLFHTVVEEVLHLMRASIPATTMIDENVADCGLVFADSGQLHQVVMNLCTNASQAIGAYEGTLEVRLELLHLEEGFIADAGTPVPGAYVCLTVRDTGHGMDEAMARRVFDPFFTTRKRGEGTGLGLSIVHGIVMANDGAITLKSEVGEGTTIRAFFPQLEGVPEPEEGPAEPSPRGSERLLFVDDDADVTDMYGQMLRALGYQVETHSDSRQALEAFRASRDGFDVVVTDHVMPGMTGAELVRAMCSMRPGQSVVLMSGASEDLTQLAAEVGAACYVRKPITPQDLSRLIQDIVRREAPE